MQGSKTYIIKLDLPPSLSVLLIENSILIKIKNCIKKAEMRYFFVTFDLFHALQLLLIQVFFIQLLYS